MPGNFHKNKRCTSLQSNSGGRKCAKSVLVQESFWESYGNHEMCTTRTISTIGIQEKERRGRGKASSRVLRTQCSKSPGTTDGWNRRESSEKSRSTCRNSAQEQEPHKAQDDRLFSRWSEKEHWLTPWGKTKARSLCFVTSRLHCVKLGFVLITSMGTVWSQEKNIFAFTGKIHTQSFFFFTNIKSFNPKVQ